MVDVIQADQRAAYADYDSRALSRDPWRVAVSDLPIVDLSPFMGESACEDRLRTARAVRAACIDIGFFYVTGHGFTTKELDHVLAQGLAFFALPLEEKMKVLSPDIDTRVSCVPAEWIRKRTATRSSTSRSDSR
jgi:isopenicillin N synthase-like dioxygenase